MLLDYVCLHAKKKAIPMAHRMLNNIETSLAKTSSCASTKAIPMAHASTGLVSALALQPGGCIGEIRKRKWRVHFVIMLKEASAAASSTRPARNALQLVPMIEQLLTYAGTKRSTAKAASAT